MFGLDEHYDWTHLELPQFILGLFPGSFCAISSMQYQVYNAHH